MTALDIANWDVAANGPARCKLGGSPTDNNAILFRQNRTRSSIRWSRLAPSRDRGRSVGRELGPLLKLMENILTGANNDVDAVVARMTARRWALQALSAQGLAGVVPISGQDATADGCNSIVKGELTVSILRTSATWPDRRRHGRQHRERAGSGRYGRVLAG